MYLPYFVLQSTPFSDIGNLMPPNLRKKVLAYSFVTDLTFDDEGKGKCVNVMDERALGYGFVDKCSDQHSYICEYPRKGYTTPPPPTTTTPVPEAQ